MEKKIKQIEFIEYTSIDEMNQELVGLIDRAEQNLQKSYAPYSGFKVSAVVQLKSGEIIEGTNQENAAFPSGICAERVALFSAKSMHTASDIGYLVIVTETSNDHPFTPCGSCLQVMSEYQQNQSSPFTIILKSGDSKIWEFKSVNDLLPFAFDAKDSISKE